MFDKYPLIHFDIEKALTAESNGIISILDESISYPSNTMKWKDISNKNEDSLNSTYQWTGSFDLLLPSILSTSESSNLYLQNFCLMNNTKESFISRSNYESILLSYTYSGEANLVYDGITYSINSQTLFIIDCRKHHEYFPVTESWQHLDIHIWGDDAEKIYQRYSNQNIVKMQYSNAAFNPLIENLLDAETILSDNKKLFISNSISNLLCTLLAHAEKEGNSTIPEIYKYIVHYIECNYMTHLSLDSLASFINVSKYHFAREFKKYTGYTPNEYILNLRIKHACVLLANTELSIEQISYEVGIKNMSNFIRQIKKRTGLTPSAFRKNIKL